MAQKEESVMPREAVQVELNPEKAAEERAKKAELMKKLDAEKIAKLKKVSKRVKMIQKKNKLFIRDVDGSARRLDKISQNLFDLVMVKFIQQDGEDLYQTANKGVGDWKQLKPIDQEIDRRYQADFERALRVSGQKESFVVYYNGTWKPLSKLKLKTEVVTTTKEEKS